MKEALYKISMDCPVCSVTFKTSKVKLSCCVVKSRDPDFCVYYKEHNPIFYDAVVCPQCGYSALFSSFADIDPSDTMKIFEGISRKWNQRDLGGERSLEDAIEAYKLALYCSQFKNNITHRMLAPICLRLAWLNRYKGDKQEERRFIDGALTQYSLIYEKERLTDRTDEVTVMYLIGELNRRLGNYQEAVKWFSRVVTHEMRFEKPGIENMAREQWSMARQQAEEERKNG